MSRRDTVSGESLLSKEKNRQPLAECASVDNVGGRGGTQCFMMPQEFEPFLKGNLKYQKF